MAQKYPTYLQFGHMSEFSQQFIFKGFPQLLLQVLYHTSMYPILRLSNDWDTFHFGMKLEVTTNKHQSPIIIPVPTKALIFTKFETYAHKIRFDYQIFFRKDPCMHTCKRAIISRMNIFLCARAFRACTRVCMHRFLVINSYRMSLSFIICKDPSFR